MTVHTLVLVCVLLKFISASNGQEYNKPSAPFPIFKVLPKIVRNDNYLSPDGSFEFNTELTDGTRHHAVGRVKNVNGEQILGVTGTYGYISPEYSNVYVEYEADENGFITKRVSFGKPQGSYAPGIKIIGSIVG